MTNPTRPSHYEFNLTTGVTTETPFTDEEYAAYLEVVRISELEAGN